MDGTQAAKSPSSSFSLRAEGLAAIVKPIVQEAVKEALISRAEQDRLMDAEQAARLLVRLLRLAFRNSRSLPLTTKLGPKMLRFSAVRIQKYLATRKSGKRSDGTHAMPVTERLGVTSNSVARMETGERK